MVGVLKKPNSAVKMFDGEVNICVVLFILYKMKNES